MLIFAVSGAAGPVSSANLKQLVWPIRLTLFFDDLEDGPRLATGPNAVALPVVTPLKAVTLSCG